MISGTIAQSHYCCIILCIAKPNIFDSLRSITYIDLLIKLASYSIDNDFEGWIKIWGGGRYKFGLIVKQDKIYLPFETSR